METSPRSRSIFLTWFLLAAAALPAFGERTGRRVFFSDGMDYATNSAIQAAWLPAVGVSPSVDSTIDPVPLPLATFHPTPAGGSFMTLGNGVRYRNLGSTLSGDWTLEAELLITGYSRSQAVYVLNEAGTQGYGFLWNGTNVNQNAGAGVVSIRKFNYAFYTDWATFGTGTQIGASGSPGHPVTGYPVLTAASSNQDLATYNPAWQGFLRLKLVWKRATGDLTLYANGLQVCQAVDTQFRGFRRVYVRGNSTGYFDNIRLTANYGADVPFTTLEAEAPGNPRVGTLNVITNKTAMESWPPNAAQEASGRGYVELANVGDYIEFPGVPVANAMVIRHCIPDAPGGGGITATLGLYVNGVFRQEVTLSSKYNWLYGPDEAWDNGQSNTPTPTSHVFWDEARLFITGGVQAGDSIRLQKRETDTATFYRIDLIEPELVPPPLSPPPAGTYYSVVDYGANGSDNLNDATAINACVSAARAQNPKRIVWLPPGTYRLNANLNALDGVKIQGAGMWYTTLLHNHTGSSGRVLQMTGDGSGAADLTIDSNTVTNRGDVSLYPYSGYGSNWSATRIWITHTPTGFWIGGNDATISECRVRLTYADALNLNNGSSTPSAIRITVRNNHIRGAGDDSLANLRLMGSTGESLNNTFRDNTAIAPWWGATCSLSGGSGHLIEGNHLADGAGLVINLTNAYPKYPLFDSIFRNNLLERCGSNTGGQRRGSIWILPDSSPVTNVLIEGNVIVDAVYRGIHAVGDLAQQITFRGNVIDRPGEDAIYIASVATGSGTFYENLSLNLGNGHEALDNNGGSDYQAFTTANPPGTPPPTLSAITHLAGSNPQIVRLTVEGRPGQFITIEVSDDLTTWATFHTFVLSAPTETIELSVPPGSTGRYFRAR